MALQIPKLLPLEQDYRDLAPKLFDALQKHQTEIPQCFEVVADTWGSEQTLAIPTTGCALANLLQAQPFAPKNPSVLPQHCELLCLNQILHRTPNQTDLLRPLLAQGFALLCVVELKRCTHNPYPSKTAGVFSYGSLEEMTCELLENCYCEIIWRFETQKIFCVLAHC